MLRPAAFSLFAGRSLPPTRTKPRSAGAWVEKLLGPDVKVEGVAKAGVLGLDQVRLATEEGAHRRHRRKRADLPSIGNIYDNKTETDENRRADAQVNADRFADLPLAQSFKIVRGKGTRQLADFADPRCSYSAAASTRSWRRSTTSRCTCR